MDIEIARTFPISRNRGYEYMRDLTKWHEWMPMKVDPKEMTFVYHPVKAIGYDGTLEILDEVEHESCSFSFDPAGFPPVEMKWMFSHAGPSAFTLRLFLRTPSEDWKAKVVESVTFMMQTIRWTTMRSLDRLEHYFLGDLEIVKEEEMKEPALVG
jgi:hypothetical protein